MKVASSKRVVATALSLLGAAGCAGHGGAAAPPAQPALRVGMTPDHPPIADRVDGERVGVDVR